MGVIQTATELRFRPVTLVGVMQTAAELRFRLVPLVGVVHMRLVRLVDAFMLSTSNASGYNV